MMLLQGAEQVEFERYPGMAGRHHRVGHELVALRAAPVAIEADIGTNLRPIQRHKTRTDIGGVGRGAGVMHRQPAFRRTVATFAAHTVPRQKFAPAIIARNIRRMATQTGGRGGGIPQLQRTCNGAAPRARQNGHGPAVGTGGRGWILPACDLVLADNGAISFRTAMTGGAGAACNAHVPPRGMARHLQHCGNGDEERGKTAQGGGDAVP